MSTAVSPPLLDDPEGLAAPDGQGANLVCKCRAER